MSFYNMIFGQNPLSDILLAMCDLTEGDVGRFRDAWITENGELAIYTRNGGGNREYYMPDFNNNLLYLRDEDDDFDSTYATIFFKIPEKYISFAKVLAEGKNPNQNWLDSLEELKQGNRPDIVEKIRPLMDQIANFVKGSTDV